MRFTSISLTLLFTTLASSAALNPATLNTLAARAPDVSNAYEDLVGYQLPDGHRKIDFYFNGALAGSVIETDDGGTSPFTSLHLFLPESVLDRFD